MRCQPRRVGRRSADGAWWDEIDPAVADRIRNNRTDRFYNATPLGAPRLTAPVQATADIRLGIA